MVIRAISKKGGIEIRDLLQQRWIHITAIEDHMPRHLVWHMQLFLRDSRTENL